MDERRRTLNEECIPFSAGDGFDLNLIHVTGSSPPSKGPILLVHGSSVRANIFRPPTRTNVVDFLVEHGYDVWLENWRASIDLPLSPWYLDDAAVYDHPAAVREVLERTGADSLKALVHCQGSTSFMIGLLAGLMPAVSAVVSNSVSTHPVVPWPARLKLNLATPLVGLMTDHLDPQWGLKATTWPARIITAVTELFHHECHNPVCKQSSFINGVGWPVMWSHDNLDAATHDRWLTHEFAHVPMTFYRQMTRSVNAGHLVAMRGHPQLPPTIVARPPRNNARIGFITGADNICFDPASQRRAYEYLSGHQPGRHSLRIIPRYGHLDVFLGTDAARDVFPIILEELEK